MATNKTEAKATAEVVEEAKPAAAKKPAAKKTTKKATATKAKVATIKNADVLVRPILTERTVSEMQNLNKITVEVLKTATKTEIKNSFEAVFGVKVSKVNTSHVRGRSKRVGKYSGLTSSYKKAIVTLAEGQSLDLLKNE